MHVAKLKAYIAVGSFVCCLSSSVGVYTGTILGRIVRRDDGNDGCIILNVFKPLTEMSYASEICRRTEGEAQGITEVVQTMEWLSIMTHQILDVCFPFYRRTNEHSILSMYWNGELLCLSVSL